MKIVIEVALDTTIMDAAALGQEAEVLRISLATMVRAAGDLTLVVAKVTSKIVHD